MTAAPTQTRSFGQLLREWRQRRRLSQLDLSLAAGVSARHVSFLETGRARPSREMVLQLAEHLAVPLRERNLLLGTAGFAPAYPARPLDAPEMTAVRDAIELILRAHEPCPAIVVDRCWNLVSMNAPALLLADGLPPELAEPPINIYRATLHPDGLARRIVNFAEVAQHLLSQLRHDVAVSADPELAALLEEVQPWVPAASRVPERGAVVVPLRLRHPAGELSLFTSIATFGTPVDVTVAELAIETFLPADEATARRLRALAEM
jgi:transcriptional regulator with XRE-family HTH domain